MLIAERYAAFLDAITTVPEGSRKMAALAVLDLIGAALAGHKTVGAQAARRSALRIWGSGESPIWCTDQKLTPVGAAFANSAAASMLDLDDGHRSAAGHPGAGVIPAILAAAHERTTDRSCVLTAIALGYEIAIRTSAARDLSQVDTLVSGRWVGQGVAAAVAWMRGLPVPQIAQAIAIAGTSAPGLGPVAYSRLMGNHLKEGIPWATATGMAAVDLAESGFTAPIDLFDNPSVFDRKALMSNLGERWAIEQIYFKPYGCCRWIHAAIEATLALLAEHELNVTSIDKIRIETFSRALQLNNEPQPATLEAAQYSIPFCVALAITEGEQSLLPLVEKALSHSKAQALANRVSLETTVELDSMFPNRVPARVEVLAQNRIYSSTILMPKGEPSNPMTRDDLEAKFRSLAHPLIGRARAAEILTAIRALRGEGPSELLANLTTPIVWSPSELETTNAAGAQ